MPSQTATAESRTKMPRSELIRRYLVRDLANLRREARPLSIVDETRVLGYFEQILYELEKFESHGAETKNK